MEFFHSVNVDWLGKKWYFLAFSMIFSVAGVLSMLFWHGIKLGIDFRGGTLIYVQFEQQPNPDRIRQAIDHAGIHDARIQTYGTSMQHQVAISLAQNETQESTLDTGRQTIVEALNANYSTTGPANRGKLDLDNASQGAVAQLLEQNDPEHLASAGGGSQKYAQQAEAILNHRDHDLGGIFSSIDQLNGVADPAVVNQLKQSAYLSGYHVFAADIIGPQVGAALRKQAFWAVMYSLAGMLVYLWFRFELIYGVAAVVAVFHDTLITVGAFSLRDKEITLTVIAAILTLIGYSMNDTIVVFDRIRENLRISRRENLTSVVNRSINQTLSRTVLTSGLTFLTVLSLYLFGGEVLHGFSFALVIGILIGTYSSIAVAAPMLVAYQEWRAKRGKKAVLPASKKARV
ncbi:MAG TPA: protein translocase subunit SecF [Acidobacteriaceae bacterium]|nr:protein translocase subunit SecF [Acidobacteriaceae bacterium]